MIPIEGDIFLDESEIEESFIRASGPGGQNINKVSTPVQLRLNLSRSRSLSEEVRGRLARLPGRLTRDGVLVITARRYRRQEGNREDSLERLVALIRRAVPPPTPRQLTEPSATAKERRMKSKASRLAAEQILPFYVARAELLVSWARVKKDQTKEGFPGCARGSTAIARSAPDLKCRIGSLFSPRRASRPAGSRRGSRPCAKRSPRSGDSGLILRG
jgi:ribosome-associated protein